MTKMTRTVALAAALVLVAAGPAAAAKPDIFRDSGGSELGVDATWTSHCGDEIVSWFRYSAVYFEFSDGTGKVTYSAERTLIGPAGTVLRRTGQTFGGTFSEVVDEVAGTVTMSFQQTTTGTHTFLELGGGVIFTESGLYYIDATIVEGPGDDVTITVHDEYVSGQRSIPEEEAFIDAICAVLVG